MILNDDEILNELRRKQLKIIPFPREEAVQPCSVDFHLGRELKSLNGETIDLKEESYKLKPNEFILGSTNEYVEIPHHICGQIEGKSTIARNGVMIHITAGYIDAGYHGNITLELYNASDKEYELSWMQPICQLILHRLVRPALRPYGSDGLNSHYQGSEGTIYGFK